MIRKLFGSIGLAVLLLGSASAQRAGRWEYLGEAHVDGAVDHDRIAVTAAKGNITRFSFVSKRSIEFSPVVVHFGNGRGLANADSGRRTDARDDLRAIGGSSSVEIWYATPTGARTVRWKPLGRR